jgi:cytoskeleton-associated protein 5
LFCKPAEKLLTPERVKQITEQLSVIFKSINSVENSKQGLEDLYDFKVNNPDVDLSKHFKKGNENFQKYIEDCLVKIGNERKMKENAENRSTQQLLNPFNGHQTSSSNLVFSSGRLASANLEIL